jgi:cell wall-associated NlpC family hydrolase
MSQVMRWTSPLVLLLAFAALCTSAEARADWARGAERAAVAAGLMAPLADGRFHGERPLTMAQLRAARDALAVRTGLPPARVDGVSVTAFDSAVVRQLGLGDVAAAVQAEARRAGLRPPAVFGTEVVARALELRLNHPYPRGEALEQYPWERISRAEAAWSLARVASLDGWEPQSVRETFALFHLPRPAGRRLRALRIAVSKIGMPYIWGGETDGVSAGQVHGGYDCSGLAWRVFGGWRLGGRTADDQAHAIRRSERVRLSEVRPGDLLFFGRHGYAAHMGIALSADFMIHASAQGVYVSSLLEPWRRDGFLWARRAL